MNIKPSLVVLTSDNACDRDEAVEILMDDSNWVVAAAAAEHAVAMIHVRWETRLVVTDVNLPGLMNGYALAQQLDLKCPGVGVVLGRRDPGSENLPSKARFLLKPYPRSSSIQAFHELLGESSFLR